MSKEFVATYNKLRIIIKHINNEQTGTPEEFRNKLHLTEHKFYNFLNILDKLNCPVKYDRTKKTYYFPYGCKFQGFRKDK